MDNLIDRGLKNRNGIPLSADREINCWTESPGVSGNSDSKVKVYFKEYK